MSSPFKRVKVSPLSTVEADRQGRIIRLAIEGLGEPASVAAFLNTPHPVLGGRPLDLAIASEAGLQAVEATIREK